MGAPIRRGFAVTDGVRGCALSLAVVTLTALVPTPAIAGPPYDTDDPVPTDLHHWEIYNFVGGTRERGAFDGAFGVDLNYGGFKEVQLTATVPFDFVRGPGGGTGFGDLELGVKYRLFHRESRGLSVAMFPRAILPTGRDSSGKVGALLPVWAEKDWKRWSLFGGGGRALNPGAGNRDYWFAGLAATRAANERLSIGAEATRHGRDAAEARTTTTLGLGATYKLKGPFALLASAGPSFAGRDGERFHAYAALELVF